MERCGVLTATQFAYREGLGNCDNLLCEFNLLQSALEIGQKDWNVQIDFCASFDTINHQKILLCGYLRFCVVISEMTLYSDPNPEGELYILIHPVSIISITERYGGCFLFLLLKPAAHAKVGKTNL